MNTSDGSFLLFSVFVVNRAVCKEGLFLWGKKVSIPFWVISCSWDFTLPQNFSRIMEIFYVEACECLKSHFCVKCQALQLWSDTEEGLWPHFKFVLCWQILVKTGERVFIYTSSWSLKSFCVFLNCCKTKNIIFRWRKKCKNCFWYSK